MGIDKSQRELLKKKQRDQKLDNIMSLDLIKEVD